MEVFRVTCGSERVRDGRAGDAVPDVGYERDGDVAHDASVPVAFAPRARGERGLGRGLGGGVAGGDSTARTVLGELVKELAEARRLEAVGVNGHGHEVEAAALGDVAVPFELPLLRLERVLARLDVRWRAGRVRTLTGEFRAPVAGGRVGDDDVTEDPGHRAVESRDADVHGFRAGVASASLGVLGEEASETFRLGDESDVFTQLCDGTHHAVVGADPVTASIAFLVVEDVLDGVVCERGVVTLGVVARELPVDEDLEWL